MADEPSNDLEILTADIIASYVGGNRIAAGDVPLLVASVLRALKILDSSSEVAVPTASPPKLTAAQIRRTISPEAIRCLECGQSFKTLRRHLLSAHGLSPRDYTTKYALPADYPLVSENTSRVRSDFARTIGLGRRGEQETPKTRKASRAPGKTPLKPQR